MFVFFPRTAGAGLISADFSHSVRSSVACCGVLETLLRFTPLSYPKSQKKFKKKRASQPDAAAGGHERPPVERCFSAAGKKSKER
jgi:hypothetical protein